MKEKNTDEFTVLMLEQLLETLKGHGYNLTYISARIGFDAKLQNISDALRGRSKKKLVEAIVNIRKEFGNVLELPVPETSELPITLKSIDDKLNSVIEKMTALMNAANNKNS